jgi:hypothetical protein
MENIQIFGIFFIILLFIFVVGVVYYLYITSDSVSCDLFGNCIFTKHLGNIEQNCYQNGEKINCSDIINISGFYDERHD